MQRVNKVSRGASLVLSTALALSLSGCLKTRAQIRGDSDESTVNADGSVRTEVTDVHSNSPAVDEMKTELARLAGRIDELERENKSLKDQSSGKTENEKKQGQALEARIMELEAAQAQMIEALKKKEREALVPQTEPVGLLVEARSAFSAKQYDLATEKLTGYLKFPKGKSTEEALSLRAESQYALAQYKKAILDYSAIRDQFPKSKRVPHALYRIGLCFEALGMQDDARVFFQELVEKFPKSSEAKKAGPKLAKKR